MKTKLGILILAILVFATTFARAQTNDLTSLLQQGLLEEQANRNLDAAIADYQTLAAQFDKNRQIAATAIFRLGECYRMLGKTNEAAAQYQRVLKDFPDQTTLATLSRQNLTGMGMSADSTPNSDVLQRLFSQRQKEMTIGNSDEESQEIQRIQTMIQNSPDLINAPDSSGNTPLSKAAYNGWLKVSAFLLDHGADVNARGGLALGKATMAGNRAMVEFLLSRGANVDANGSGKTALATAAEKDFQAVAEVLIAHKADVNATDNRGETPLHLAVAYRRIKIVQMLLAADANVNVENNQARTPLSYAAENGSTEMVKMLLAAKADPNGGKLDAPLLAAINAKDTNSAELLLQAGANPNVLGKVDWDIFKNGTTYSAAGQPTETPLFLAIFTKQFPMVQLLLKYKADPNDSQTDNRSLLFSALPDTNIVEALLDAGANVDARDSIAKTGDNRLLNWTPLLLAVENNFSADLVEILLKHGANPNLRDGAFGQTPLHWILGWGDDRLPNQRVLELLLDYKADPNVRNNSGKTPLDLLKLRLTRNDILMRNDISAEQKTAIAQLADLLRQHGAVDKLPDWDRITVSRPFVNFSRTVFSKGTNGWNQVSLFDVLGVQYDLVASPLNNAARYSASPYSRSDFATRNDLAFPDLSNVTIRHPSADGKKWETRKVDLAHALDTGDYNADILLQWGDVVEIPEADHVINQRWTGLTTDQLLSLKNCLTRHLQITVNGRTTSFVVSPQVTIRPGSHITYTDGSYPDVTLLTGEPFMLWPVLNESKTLLASSDLARVKIKRTDTAGKIHEWTVDCSDSKSPPNFWLRDGDVVEVPEK